MVEKSLYFRIIFLDGITGYVFLKFIGLFSMKVSP